MPLIIPDEALRAAGLEEDSALLEIACRLFQSGKLSLPAAAKFAELDRSQFEQALLDRGIALCRPTIEDLQSDLGTIDGLNG